jgi:hypothetical protein
MHEAIKGRVEAALRWECPDCGGALAWAPAMQWHPCYAPEHRARFCGGQGCFFVADLWERVGEPPRTAYAEWYIERHGTTGEMAFCIGTRPADRVAPTEA